MTLRTYFDAARAKDGTKSTEKRAHMRGTTIKKGGEAARHLRHAQSSIEKLRAHQEQRKKEYA